MLSHALPRLTDGAKKKWSYSALLFSLFYFFPILFNGQPDAPEMLIIFIGYGLFVAAYTWAINERAGRIVFPLFTIFAITCTISAFFAGAAVFVGFIAFLAGYHYPLIRGLTVTVFTAATLLLLQIYWQQAHPFFVYVAVINAMVLLGFGSMERRETIAQLREAEQNAAIGALSAIAERERIGRDLHDIAGHALSCMSLKAQLADKLMEKGRYDHARAEVQSLTRLSQSLLSEIRHAVSDMKKMTLAEEINNGATALQALGFEVTAQTDEHTLTELTALQETHLALIVKEAMTNILRHSNGKAVTIITSKTNNMLEVIIKDNGKTDKFTVGNGIAGMRERATLTGATLNLSSGDHTTLHLILPLQQQEHS